MRFRHPAWIPLCWMLSLANIVSVWFAARSAEPWHATAHAMLAVAFALGARHLREGGRRWATESGDGVRDARGGAERA